MVTQAEKEKKKNAKMERPGGSYLTFIMLIQVNKSFINQAFIINYGENSSSYLKIAKDRILICQFQKRTFSSSL